MPIKIIDGILCNVSPHEELEVLEGCERDIRRALNRLMLLYANEQVNWILPEMRSMSKLVSVLNDISIIQQSVRIAIESQEESYGNDGTESYVRPSPDPRD